MEAVSQSQPFAISADCRVNQPSLLHLLSLLLPGHTYLLGSNILGCIWVFQLRQAAASSQSTSVWTSLTLLGKILAGEQCPGHTGDNRLGSGCMSQVTA